MPVGFSLLTKTSEKLLAAPVRLNAPGRRREVGRLRRADDVGVAGGIDRDAGGDLVARAAEERRVLEARVDDQLVIRPVARADREPVCACPAVAQDT